MSTAKAIIESVSIFKKYNLRIPVEITLDAKQWDKFARDVIFFRPNDERGKPASFTFNNIVIKRKKCICGAYPE